MGPGYAFEVNTLRSTLELFIGDAAAEAIADAETALEKATASRGLLAVQYNEPDLYGYTDENEVVMRAFLAGEDAFLNWKYGLEIMKLVMAAYMSHERGRTIDLTDPAVQQELETYIPSSNKAAVQKCCTEPLIGLLLIKLQRFFLCYNRER